GEVDRILYMLHAANCAGLQCLSFHNGRVHLVCAGAGKYRTAAGVEMRVVLEHSHSRFRCIETRSATLQNFVTSLQRVFKPCSIFTLFFRCHVAALNRPGAAVNRESNFFCFHVWIVIGPFFPCRSNRPLGLRSKPGRRSIKEQENKEAIGCASSSKSHQRKCNAVAGGMSTGVRPNAQGTTAWAAEYT